MLDSLFNKFDKIVVLDVETTGFDSRRDEIIEVAAIKIASGAGAYHVEHELDVLVQLSEGRTLPYAITNLTGITEQLLTERGESKDKACEKLIEVINAPETLLVAYNAQFDLCFLYFFLLKHKRPDVLKQVKMLDVMSVYKDRRDYPHKLSDAIVAYNLDNQNSHRAMADAKATLAILVAKRKKKDDLDKYVNLFGYNPKYGVAGPRISSITYLPQGYNRKGRLYE
jgi:DNA polymerase-3 subunit epsilon